MVKLVNRTRLGIAGVLTVAITIAGCGSDAASNTPSGENVDEAARALLPDRITDAGTLRFVGGSNPPYRIINGSEVSGADAEMVKALGEVLGVKATFEVSSDGDAARTGILADRYDVYMGPSLLDSERHMQFDGVANSVIKTVLLMKADNTTISGEEDLCGKTVASVTGGTDAEKIAELSKDCEGEGQEPIEQLLLGDPQTVVLSVLSGRVDAASTTNTAAADATRAEESLKTVQTGEVLGEGLNAGLLTLPDTSEALQAAYEVLFENGDYSRIMEEWNLQDAEIEKPLLNAVYEE